MRERQGPEKINHADYLGINWPNEGLSPELAKALIASSKDTPLRELIARIVIQEAKELAAQYHQFCLTSSGDRTPVDIAIKDGYQGVGESLLLAHGYFSDREGAVSFNLRAVEVLENLSDTKNGVNNADLKKGFVSQMERAVISLTVDPTGVDLLRRRLQTKDVVWNKLIKNYPGEEDPEVIGFRKGFERYRDLYSLAVSMGAQPDHAERGRIRRALLKFKRDMEENPFLAISRDLFYLLLPYYRHANRKR